MHTSAVRFAIATCFFGAAACAPQGGRLAADHASSSGETLSGEWLGEYQTSEARGELAIKIGNANGAWSVAVRAESRYSVRPTFQSARDVLVAGDTVRFALSWGTPVRWTGIARGDSLVGTLQSDHWTGTWKVRRTELPEAP